MYDVDVMPDQANTSLISVAQIVDEGHNVQFTADGVSIMDKDGKYCISYPRGRSLAWRVPIKTLDVLTEMKRKHRTNLSARLHKRRLNTREKALDLHCRMVHAPEDVMCKAIGGEKPAWVNTGVTVEDIRKIFTEEPCLPCVMCKRRADGPNRWVENNKKRIGQRTWHIDASNEGEEVKYEGRPARPEDREWSTGQCITVDNVGPINPESIDGFQYFFLFKDVYSRKVFVTLTDTCDEDSYLGALEDVLRYFKKHGHRPRVIRTDYYTTFNSAKVKEYESLNNLSHESSSPYIHWQNAVEREVQTLTRYVSTILHDQPFLRASAWSYALTHWTTVYNRLPNMDTGKSPDEIVRGSGVVDAKSRFRFTFGDLLTFGLPKPTRKGKFDARNDLGLYLGDVPGMKGAVYIYQPYEHKVKVRSDVYKLNISTLQYLSWYGKRAALRERTLPFKQVSDAVVDLLNDRRDGDDEMEQGGDTEAVSYWTDIAEDDFPDEDEDQEADDDTNDNAEPREDARMPPEVEETPLGPRQRRTPERLAYAVQELDQLTERLMKIEEDPPEIASAMSSTYLETVHSLDPEAEEVTIKDALTAPDSDKFVEAIKKEIHSLIHTTGTLEPITEQRADELNAIQIGTTVKTKRKKRGDGTPDKHKARSAARGDQLSRILRKQGKQQPPSYSPTVSTLTFMLLLQLAVIRGWTMGTTDITSAYLQVEYPESAQPLVTKLEPDIARICGLDPSKKYRIRKYLYGLPDSGRAFYQFYRNALEDEGYKCSKVDPCLFTKKIQDETTYVIIHVDDTYIFTDKASGLDSFVEKMNKHFPVTLDRAADSFLGIKIQHNKDGSVELSQPKLISKLIREAEKHNVINTTIRRRKETKHPYGSNTDKGSDEPVDSKIYLSLVGMLLYLTKSRPDIMTATSFAATNASKPTRHNLEQVLEIIKYVKDTRDTTYKIAKGSEQNVEKSLRVRAQVDASYLTHPDSHSHTGYGLSMGENGSFFYVRSSKQSDIATSSTHAEMKALYTLVKDILFIVQLMDDIKEKIELPIIILEDNAAVVTMATEQASQMKRSKHFLMITNYVKEMVSRGIVYIKKVRGEENTADILTKKVRSADFRTKAMKMMGCEETIEKYDDHQQAP